MNFGAYPLIEPLVNKSCIVKVLTFGLVIQPMKPTNAALST